MSFFNDRTISFGEVSCFGFDLNRGQQAKMTNRQIPGIAPAEACSVARAALVGFKPGRRALTDLVRNEKFGSLTGNICPQFCHLNSEGMDRIRKMENLTPEERLNRICKILLKGIYLYAKKQGWLEDEDPNKDHAKGVVKNDCEQRQIGSKTLPQSSRP